jgi:hypothetical protein
VLFDEFEDVIQNLNNRTWQQSAFWNLFEFFRGTKFPGRTYFAVTPDFVEKCKRELLGRGVYDFPYDRFDQLPAFELLPIGREDFVDLARRIRAVHGLAFGWSPGYELDDDDLEELATDAFATPSPDRVRKAIQQLVEALDERCDTLD